MSEKKRRLRPRPKAMPLRTWLVVLIVIVSGLGLAGSSLAVSSIMRNVLIERADRELADAGNTWARGTDLFSDGINKRLPFEFAVIQYSHNEVFSFNVRDTTPAVDDVVIGEPTTVGSITSDGSASDTKWRVYATENDGVVTVVAKDLTPEFNVLRRLATVQIIILTLVLAIIALAGYFFIRRALQPLREVESTASRIAAGDLDARVPDWPLHTEVGQLAAALNTMLARLQDSIEQAQSQEEKMRRFVGDASHELRTPLTSLRGYTELYRSGATNDVNLVFSKIDAESKRMSLLVEDLLALTRAEGSRLDLKPVDMLELTLSAGSSARAAFPGRSVEVVNKAQSIPMVNGDPDRLHQVLLNLISNGFRHGGPEAAVTLELAKEGSDVLVRVRDDGKGMDPEVASHIFERFYREDSSRTRDTGGSGLGLAIVKSLVEQHGGSITVESEPEKGSTFTVRLPEA